MSSSSWWHPSKESRSKNASASQPPQHWLRRAILSRSCTPGDAASPCQPLAQQDGGKQRRKGRRDHHHHHQPQQDLSTTTTTTMEEHLKDFVVNPTWKSLLFSHQLADVLVHCHDEVTLPAHKKILAAASPTLEQVLVLTHKSKRKSSRKSSSSSSSMMDWIVPYPAYVMRAVLSFIYLGPHEPLHQRLMQHEPWKLWKVAQDFSFVLLLQELNQAQAPQQAPSSSSTNNTTTSILRNHRVTSQDEEDDDDDDDDDAAVGHGMHSSLGQRQRTQSSTSTTLSSSVSSNSTTTSSLSTFRVPKALAQNQQPRVTDKYLVPPMLLVTAKRVKKKKEQQHQQQHHHENDNDSHSSGDHSSQSAGSIVSLGSNSIQHRQELDNDDDDDDESSAAHPWLSNMFLTAAQTNCCRPGKDDLNQSYELPADFSSMAESQEENDGEDDDYDDASQDGDDEHNLLKLNDEPDVHEALHAASPGTARQQSNMSDLTGYTERRHFVYQKIHQENVHYHKEEQQQQLQQQQDKYESSEAGSSNPSIGIVGANPEPLRNLSSPPKAHAPVDSNHGLELVVPTPVTANATTTTHSAKSSKVASSTATLQTGSFREKFQRKIRNRLEQERPPPQSSSHVVSPQAHSEPPSPAHQHHSSTDASPNSSMNVDKIELLNVESSYHYQQQPQHQQQQQYDNNTREQERLQVQMIIRGPTMTLPNGTRGASHRSFNRSTRNEDHASLVDRRSATFDHFELTHDPEHGAPIVVSPLSVEPRQTDTASRFLSPPPIHRVVTPLSTKSTRNVAPYDKVSVVTTNRSHENFHPTTGTEHGRGDGEEYHPNQQQKQKQPSRAPSRGNLRDASVDSKMVALVMSRLKEQKQHDQDQSIQAQQKQQQQNKEGVGKDYNHRNYWVEDGDLLLDAASDLNLSMREGNSVEVSFSAKEMMVDQDRHEPPPQVSQSTVSRQDMIHKLRRVVALYKKQLPDTHNNNYND